MSHEHRWETPGIGPTRCIDCRAVDPTWAMRNTAPPHPDPDICVRCGSKPCPFHEPETWAGVNYARAIEICNQNQIAAALRYLVDEVRELRIAIGMRP